MPWNYARNAILKTPLAARPSVWSSTGEEQDLSWQMLRVLGLREAESQARDAFFRIPINDSMEAKPQELSHLRPKCLTPPRNKRLTDKEWTGGGDHFSRVYTWLSTAKACAIVLTLWLPPENFLTKLCHARVRFGFKDKIRDNHVDVHVEALLGSLKPRLCSVLIDHQ